VGEESGAVRFIGRVCQNSDKHIISFAQNIFLFLTLMYSLSCRT